MREIEEEKENIMKQNSLKRKRNGTIDTIIEILILVFFILLYTGTFLGESLSTHRSLLQSIPLIISLILYAIKKHGIIKMRITWYHIYILQFACYSCLSAVWAINRENALLTGWMLFITFVFMTILYVIFEYDFSISALLKIVMLGGYAVVIYVAVYFGIDYIRHILSEGFRLPNDVINVNVLGMCAADSILISIYFLILRKEKKWILLAFPALLMLSATGSRTAMFQAIFEIFALLFFKAKRGKNALRSFARVTVTVLILVVVALILTQLPVFDSVNNRIKTLLLAFGGSRGGDSSALLRMKMIDVGIKLFKKSPFVGIGWRNAQIAASPFLGGEMYLHNNYIEVLANGGIIGLILCYSMHLYLLYVYLKFRNFEDMEYNLCFVMLISRLLFDVGTVSYSTSYVYVHFLILYLKARRLKKERVISY